MSGTANRQDERRMVGRVELVTIFRDRQDRPYEELCEHTRELTSIHTIFSLVARVRDASQDGLGISFEGQQIMADNILKPGERYIVKLTLVLTRPPAKEAREHVFREGNYYGLLLKMTCRWHEAREKASIAGFELRPDNPEAVVEFVRRRFGIGGPSGGG